MDIIPANLELAHLIYLLILLILVASFLFGDFRKRLSKNLQSAAIWFLIFLSAIALYGFKGTIESQLFPRTTVQQIGDEIVLTRAGDGHFYATLTVNDADITFVVDTGATNVVISRDDALRVGIDPDTLAYTGRAQTANGTVETANVRLDEVRFANRTDRNLRASVNGGQLDTSLLGMAYLNRFSTIQISGNQMRLIP